MFKDYYKWLFSIKGIKKIAALLCVLLVVFAAGIFVLESNMTRMQIQSENEKELGRLEVVLEKELNKISDLARYLVVAPLKALPQDFTPAQYDEYYNSIQHISLGLLVSDSIHCISVQNAFGEVTYAVPGGAGQYSATQIAALDADIIEYNRNTQLLRVKTLPGLLFMRYLPGNLSAGAHEVFLTLDLHSLSESCLQEIDAGSRSYILAADGTVLLSAKSSEIGLPISQLYGVSAEALAVKPNQTGQVQGKPWQLSSARTEGGLLLLHAAEKAGYSAITAGSVARGLLFCLIYLAITAMLVLVIFRSILRPIRTILNVIDTNMLAGEGYGPDVMGYIYTNISGLYSKNSVLSQRVYDTLRELRRQQLIAGQMQINPHFLSNTLSAVNWMAMEQLHSIDNPISDSLTLLSDIFHTSLNTSEIIVPIEREIAATKKYIEILKLRYGADFNVYWETDPQLYPKYILKTVLQPLIENCASHAFSNYTGERNVYIFICKKEGDISVAVQDNGVGMAPEKLEALRKSVEDFDSGVQQHIGLRNIHHRLKLLYGEGYGLTIESEKNRFTRCSFRYPDTAPAELNIDL